MNSKTLAYRVLVFMMVFGVIWSTGACSDNSATNGASQADGAFVQAQVTPTSPPGANATPGSTASTSPSATPTEVPLILPTPTEVGAGTPIPTGALLPPPTFTPVPTNTPVPPTRAPTRTPVPPPTPTPTALIKVAGVVGGEFPGFQDPRWGFDYPLTNQCIKNAFLNPLATPKPAENYASTSLAARAEDKAWFDATVNLYIRPPTSTDLLYKSLVITDANAYETRHIDYRPDLVLIWHVMNNLTIQLVDPDTSGEFYERNYEQAMGAYIDRMLTDTRARIIIGNVPDLTSLWYFKPCFSADVLRRIQGTYNGIIANMTRKNPSRVFVADLTTIDLGKYSQYIAVEDGFWLTVLGHREIAKRFANVIRTLGITAPQQAPSLYYPGSPAAGSGSSGGGGGGGSPAPGTSAPGGGSPAPGTTVPGTTVPETTSPGSGTTAAGTTAPPPTAGAGGSKLGGPDTGGGIR